VKLSDEYQYLSMKSVSLKELKQELSTHSQSELLAYCLRLSKFKKDNKELLTYLLFESFDEIMYVVNVKNEINGQFEQINKTNYYFIRKSVRKILVNTKKYIRYSQKKETEIDLLLHFCTKLKELNPSISGNAQLTKLFNTQIELIKNKISLLHEDLQFDYGFEVNKLVRL
jgi:predicted nucleotidyltransferase